MCMRSSSEPRHSGGPKLSNAPGPVSTTCFRTHSNATEKMMELVLRQAAMGQDTNGDFVSIGGVL